MRRGWLEEMWKVRENEEIYSSRYQQPVHIDDIGVI